MAARPFESRFIRTADGERAVFKPCQPPHSLLEFVVARLARAVGLHAPEYLPTRLPTGEFGLVCPFIRPPFIEWAELPADIPVPELAGRFEPSAFPSLLAFDAWVGTGDRHGHNLLVRTRHSGRPWQLWVIDNTHAC